MEILNNTYKENYKGFIGDISNEEFIIDTIKEISNLGDIKVLINNAWEPSFKMQHYIIRMILINVSKGLKGWFYFQQKY